MFDNFKKVIILLTGILLLAGCGIQDISENGTSENAHPDVIPITAVSDLVETDHFREHALEHILEGELNSKGHAVGFHFDGLPTKKGKVVEGTETESNEFGVYEAKVEVSGVSKTSNGGKSSFFPKDWNTQQVVDVINQAYESREQISGNTYEGLTSDGMVIRMYLDKADKIISAFPVY